jgi:hypothetical protein
MPLATVTVESRGRARRHGNLSFSRRVVNQALREAPRRIGLRAMPHLVHKIKRRHRRIGVLGAVVEADLGPSI